jgi:ribitol-5-phosphate 2-dehydrogenase
MINQIYRLTAPRRVEVTHHDISLQVNQVVVRPTYMSICHADQRYFSGKRPAEVLAKKLPMAMIHEAIGEVVYDPTGQFHVGQNVVMVPNTPFDTDEIISENYLYTSKFRSSGYDGYMQDYVFMRPDRLVVLPVEINPEVAAFTELVSVSMHALDRFNATAHPRKRSFGLWGDGNLGFITSLLLRKMFPEAKIYVFGKTDSKLDYFTFGVETYRIDQIPAGLTFDHAFECVGGIGSQHAINQIIDHIQPEGIICLLGVSEDLASINTRMVLEKGLKLVGSSRSGTSDFKNTVDFYVQYPDVVAYLANLVSNVHPIRQIEDIYKAFELDSANPFGKTVLKWEI